MKVVSLVTNAVCIGIGAVGMYVVLANGGGISMCRQVVLKDIREHAAYTTALAKAIPQQEGHEDFLTALTKNNH